MVNTEACFEEWEEQQTDLLCTGCTVNLERFRLESITFEMLSVYFPV